MYLVQLLLPLFDRRGAAHAQARIAEVERVLVERFGGATSYARAPASGRWREDGGAVEHDDLVVCEVMVDRLDRAWWSEYRASLAVAFDQQELVVRASPMELL